MSPVAFDSDTSSMSASRLIGISPWRSSMYMMWSWAMLMPEPHEALAPSALELGHRAAEVGDDRSPESSVGVVVASRDASVG